MTIDNNALKRSCILIADDSAADRNIIERVLQDSRIICNFQEVENGEELLLYLNRKTPYEDAVRFPWPDILLLDINMPRLNGKEALEKIRAMEKGKSIPVIMLTTSKRDQDVIESYALGVNAFITKPVEHEAFVKIVQQLEMFWFELVTLPKTNPQLGKKDNA